MQHGYDGATIRGIAAGAGVDAALVHHYFGSKERLLVAALQPEALALVPDLLAEGLDGLGERLLRAAFTTFESGYPAGWGTLIGLVRSATTHEEAAALLRESFASGGLTMLVDALRLPQARLRAALIGTELFGMAMARFIVRLEPIASADIESLVSWYAPNVQRYLTEPLAEPSPGAAAAVPTAAPVRRAPTAGPAA